MQLQCFKYLDQKLISILLTSMLAVLQNSQVHGSSQSLLEYNQDPTPSSWDLKGILCSFRLVLERRAGKEITEPSRFYSKQFCLLAINIISKLKLKLRLKPRGCNVSNI